MAAARGPEALTDEIIEEIILRLPPAEPASLVRAALVCKPWCGLIASPRFRRRFRAFHRTAPMLGLLCNIREGDARCVTRFVPTSPVHPPPGADQRESFTCEDRHGRVLLSSMTGSRADLAIHVWNPMTNERWQLPPGPSLHYQWSVAVLCAAIGACDHHDCPRGAFLVAAITTCPRSHKVKIWIYSSEAGTWRKKTYVTGGTELSADLGPTALVGNTLYFPVNQLKMIVSYDLESWETRVIHGPPMSDHCATVAWSSLMMMEDGGIGVARLDDDARLSIWSMEVNPNGEKGWTQIRVFELVKLLSINARSICFDFVGLSHGVGIFFKGANDGLFTIDLKSGLIKKVVCEGLCNNGRFDVFPYTTFYTPALRAVYTEDRPRGVSGAQLRGSALGAPAASTGEGPSMDASSGTKA